MDAPEKKRPKNCGPWKTSLKLHQILSQKIATSVEFASRASIYNPEVTATELTTAQTILLSLMHSLLTNDMGFCTNLLELATSVDHLKSSYLSTWLKDDFNFIDQQVIQLISKTALLVRSGLLIIPYHILKVFAGLAPKYRVAECCTASGNTEVLDFLAGFGVLASTNSSMSSSVSRNVPTSNNVQDICHTLMVQAAGLNRNICNSGATAASSSADINDIPDGVSDSGVSSLSNELVLLNSVERIENHSPEVQEVWVEVAEAAALPLPMQPSTWTANEAAQGPVSTESYIAKVREYLKVPADFEEEELMQLINYSDTEGGTPLHNAVREGDPYVVEAMLELGAVVDATDTFGYTPTHCAAGIGSVRMLQVLAQHRANLSLDRHDGCTPLHEAVINGHVEASKWLLDHGAGINVRNSDGWTPLHLAANWNQLDIVKLLINKGADLETYNNNGKTPGEVAREEGNTAIVRLLSIKKQ